MRSRVEDLGRIAEKLSVMLEREVFADDIAYKDEEDITTEDIASIRTQINLLRDDLLYLYDIARWGDTEFQPIRSEHES